MDLPRKKRPPGLPPKPPGGGAAGRRRQFEQERGLTDAAPEGDAGPPAPEKDDNCETKE